MTERGYEVIVFIPDEAPLAAREAVFDAVEKACGKLERRHRAFKKRNWDLGITGGPHSHSLEELYLKEKQRVATLSNEVAHLQSLLSSSQMKEGDWFEAWQTERDARMAAELDFRSTIKDPIVHTKWMNGRPVEDTDLP